MTVWCLATALPGGPADVAGVGRQPDSAAPASSQRTTAAAAVSRATAWRPFCTDRPAASEIHSALDAARETATTRPVPYSG